MKNPSYQRSAPIVVTERMRRQIAGAVAEIDLAQITISKQLTPVERTCQALSMIAAAQRVAAYRLRVRDPGISEEEALRIVRSIGITEYERRKSHQQEHQL